jgi:hypothetical protein
VAYEVDVPLEEVGSSMDGLILCSSHVDWSSDLPAIHSPTKFCFTSDNGDELYFSERNRREMKRALSTRERGGDETIL